MKEQYKVIAIIGIFGIIIIGGYGIWFNFLINNPTEPFEPYEPFPPYDPPPDDPPDDPPDSKIEVDATGTVYYIVDGDTYDQSGLSDGDRVRLADIDCPESYENGYQEAKDYLTLLIYDKFVYVDIDDIYGTGYYGRWICVVYVRYNSTHVLNVNYAIVLNGFGVIDDYYNEFDPYNWQLYYYYEAWGKNPK